MRIDWKEEICGLPLLRVRHLLRRAGSDQFSIGFVISVLEIKPKSARDLIAELMRRGWLEKAKPMTPRRAGRKTDYFETTVAGNAFAISRAVRRISRAKAHLILKGFLERVKAVNADDDFGWYVVEVRVFGSYLDPSFSDLGDIDLGIELARRPIIGRDVMAHNKERVKLSGRTSLTFFQELGFAELEVRRILKARNPYISMHRLDDVEDIKAKNQQLYRVPKKDAKPREHRQLRSKT